MSEKKSVIIFGGLGYVGDPLIESLKDEYKYVESFWRGNVHYERCWVPWDWCEIEFTQSANNSLVMFSPNDSTIHAVKADYNHLSSQRTQLYGNL